MTDVFKTSPSRAYRAVQALKKQNLRTSELAAVMGIPARRVHAYLRWAMDARAVAIASRGGRGGQNGARTETVWSIGPTPTILHGDLLPEDQVSHKTRPIASVFEWRPT